MKKDRIRGMVILCVLMAVFSLIAFLVPFNRTPVFWIAYGCGVFAVLFQIYIFKTSFGGKDGAKSKFYGFPIARLGVYYLIAQLVLSFIEMAVSGLIPVWAAVIVNALALSFALIGCVTAETMRDEIARQDAQLKQNVSRMRELQSRAATMVSYCTDDTLKMTVRKIADELKFSDPISSDDTAELEEDMRKQISDIQQALIDGDTEGAKALCEKLMENLNERNRVCLVSKQQCRQNE